MQRVNKANFVNLFPTFCKLDEVISKIQYGRVQIKMTPAARKNEFKSCLEIFELFEGSVLDGVD